MATPPQIESLKNQIATLGQVDLEKLKRSTLGSGSLTLELESRLTKVERLKRLALEYATEVSDEAVSQIASIFGQIGAAMAQQANHNDSQFLAQRPTFLTQFDALLEQAKRWVPYFVTAAIESRGFLEDEGIRQEYQRTVGSLKEQAEATLNEVKVQADRILTETRKLAQEIEEKARRTATKISVREAQDQFVAAQNDLQKKVKLWSWLTGGALVWFFALAIFFWWGPSQYQWMQLGEERGWAAAYHGLIRFVILSAVAALAGFSLKMLRAYMNMSERNLHRQRIANSIEAFVMSGQTPEVRDVIWAHLVEAVSTFGISGILAKDTDSVGTPKLTAEAVTRLISSLTSSTKGTS